MHADQHARPPGTGPARVVPARGRPWRIVVYALLALAGLVGTWWANIAFFRDPQGMSYLGSWFANPGAASAAIDLLVVSAAACVLLLTEAARLGWRKWAWIIVPIGLLVAMAFAIPAFLAAREWALWHRARAVHGEAPGAAG